MIKNASIFGFRDDHPTVFGSSASLAAAGRRSAPTGGAETAPLAVSEVASDLLKGGWSAIQEATLGQQFEQSTGNMT